MRVILRRPRRRSRMATGRNVFQRRNPSRVPREGHDVMSGGERGCDSAPEQGVRKGVGVEPKRCDEQVEPSGLLDGFFWKSHGCQESRPSGRSRSLPGRYRWLVSGRGVLSASRIYGDVVTVRCWHDKEWFESYVSTAHGEMSGPRKGTMSVRQSEAAFCSGVTADAIFSRYGLRFCGLGYTLVRADDRRLLALFSSQYRVGGRAIP